MLLSAHLDRVFPPHSCKRGPHPTHEIELRFLHIKGLHKLGVNEKTPNYTGFAAKAHNTAVNCLLLSLFFAFSPKHFKIFQIRNVPQQHIPAPPGSSPRKPSMSGVMAHAEARVKALLSFSQPAQVSKLLETFHAKHKSSQSSCPAMSSLSAAVRGQRGQGREEQKTHLLSQHRAPGYSPVAVLNPDPHRPSQESQTRRCSVLQLAPWLCPPAAGYHSFGLSQPRGNVVLIRNGELGMAC